MHKVRIKDLQLAMEYIQKNGHSEYVDFDDGFGGVGLSISFIDKAHKACEIYLYDASKGITPEVRVTTKLYKKE